MCHTEWRGSESTKQTIHVYKEKQTDPTNEEVGMENKPTTRECYRITEKNQPRVIKFKKKLDAELLVSKKL